MLLKTKLSLLTLAVSQVLFYPVSSIANVLQEVIEVPEITVTAERRDQLLSEVASTIDVIESNQLEDNHAFTLRDISNHTSNLLVQPTETYKAITIRGVGGGGRNVGFDSRVGVYVDGVFMGQGIALDNPIYDIDQIEVLKGPQGYLFGNGSDAGAINIVTKQPSHQSERSFTAGVGNFGYLESTFKLNGELTNKLTGRFVMRSEDHDGFVRNTFDNGKLKQLWRFATRGQLKYEVNDQLDLTIAADYSKSRPDTYLIQSQTGMFGQPANPPASFDRTEVNDRPSTIIKAQGVQLNANYYFADDGQFTAILASRDTRTMLSNDIDYSRDAILRTEFDDSTEQTSQEFRYTSPDSIAWPFVAGLYFYQQDARNDRPAFLGSDLETNVTIQGIGTLPIGSIFGVQEGASVPLDGRVKTNTHAIYTNIDHSFWERYQLHLGGRYSWEKKHLDFSVDGTQSGGFGIATLKHYQDNIRQHFFSPMVGLSYQLSTKSRVYGKFSRAYKSGGWNVEFLTDAQVSDGFEYEPESVNAYEFGYRYSSTATKLGISAFINHYQDYQVFQFANLGGNTVALQLRNAAEVIAKGIELDIRHVFNHQWSMAANLAYLDAKFERFPGGSVNGTSADGQRLPDAPKWSGAAALNYQNDFGVLNAPLKISLQTNFQSSLLSGISNEPENARIAGRAVINANIGYTSPNQQWDVNFWVRNLANKEYVLAKGRDFLANEIQLYARPRMYGVYATYHF